MSLRHHGRAATTDGLLARWRVAVSGPHGYGRFRRAVDGNVGERVSSALALRRDWPSRDTQLTLWGTPPRP